MIVLGRIISGISGTILWFFWLGALTDWWGAIGFIAAIILTPGVVFFPLLYWMVEGVFPTMYFVILAISGFGLWISWIGFKADGEDY
jgi:hypothetical protein|tara:strand:- start:70 stop:330 length:261 start_codon:yes stop_codon:yes gene_type:complete